MADLQQTKLRTTTASEYFMFVLAYPNEVPYTQLYQLNYL